MLCSRFKQIPLTKPISNNNVRCRCLTTTNNILKKCWTNSFFTSVFRSKVDITKMSSIRFLLKDLKVTRFWSIWSRNINVGNVVRRCRRDRSVRGVLQCVRQTFLKSRKTILLSATAAYKVDGEGGEDEPPPCEDNITDEDLQKLLTDLETIQVLIKETLYCTKCKQRIVIDRKLPSVKYCICKEPEPPELPADGWVPYMEAEDVIIWRKEYKPGQGLYAYKVYGHYKEVLAQHFAAIQVDGGYRRVWDSAVAALSIVERSANGVLDQAILHWEVLWPRLFANRDYVYIRRHKEFDLSAQVVPTPVPSNQKASTPVPSNQKASTPVPNNQKGAVPVPNNPKIQSPVPNDQKLPIPATAEATPAKKDHKPDITDQTSDKPVKKKFRNPATFDFRRKPDTSNQNSEQTPVAEEEKHTAAEHKPAAAEHKPAAAEHKPAPTEHKPAAAEHKPAAAEQTATTGHTVLTSGKASGAKEALAQRIGKKMIDKLTERPSVHSKAKRKAEELYKEDHEEEHGDRAFVIVSRSCVHPEVPETKNAIRVTEYWSHMVVKTLNGADHPGMEFVLTYYDEPAVGGMPPGVASWATGRAAPAFLMNMRKAAVNYREYASRRRGKDPPDFTPFRPDKVSYEEEAKLRHRVRVSEEDMESSKHGPELENGERTEVTREQSTQTESNLTKDEVIGAKISQQEIPNKPDDRDAPEKTEEDDEKNASWWRQLYPFYYFV